jgi:adenylylsulfate kinase
MAKKAGRKLRPAVLWFTGLSGSGKSTIAEKVVAELRKLGADVEYLDGDMMRGIFPNTGFTKDARNEHVRRVGYLAGMLEKHGVIVVASFISPYREGRMVVRKLCRNFVEIHVSTPLAECERRDPKGLYRKARRGEIGNFTGISDPYEPPKNPELTIDTTGMTLAESGGLVMNYLMRKRKNG